jgi:hypothetical protein
MFPFRRHNKKEIFVYKQKYCQKKKGGPYFMSVAFVVLRIWRKSCGVYLGEKSDQGQGRGKKEKDGIYRECMTNILRLA